MAINKADARKLQDAHELFSLTHDHDDTTTEHQTMLKKGMRHLKSVFQPAIDGPSNPAEELGAPLLAPTTKHAATPGEVQDIDSAFGIANDLSSAKDMHRAGKSMMKEAAAVIKAVRQPLISDRPDDLAAKMLGMLSVGHYPSPGVLATLKEVVDSRLATWEEDALESIDFEGMLG